MTASEEFRERLVSLLPRLRRFAGALAGSREAAEDLVQSTVERALARSGAYDPERRLESWLFKMMQNLWIDTRRGAAPTTQVEFDDSQMEYEDGRAVVELRDELRAVQAAFALLPEEQRSVMSLVILEGFSYAETAEALGVRIGTVMSRLARARASIAAAVRGQAAIAQVRKQS